MRSRFALTNNCVFGDLFGRVSGGRRRAALQNLRQRQRRRDQLPLLLEIEIVERVAALRRHDRDRSMHCEHILVMRTVVVVDDIWLASHRHDRPIQFDSIKRGTLSVLRDRGAEHEQGEATNEKVADAMRRLASSGISSVERYSACVILVQSLFLHYSLSLARAFASLRFFVVR